MSVTGLHERMTEAAEGRTFRAIGDLTDFNSETVRRYMQGQAPSVEFVAAFCDALGICVDWLLTGRGPMKRDEARAHVLKDANPGELLSAVAGGLEEVSDRLERVERFVQSLEARVRAELLSLEEKGRAKRREPEKGSIDGTLPRPVDPAGRARSIAGAIAGGSNSNAD